MRGPALRPTRVIHIVESLDVGAVENWLLRMLEAGHDLGVPLDWTFYCTLTRPGRFDQRARELGATVLHSPVALDSKLQFFLRLRRTLRVGKYDVLHCHHDILSAVYLMAASGLSIPREIVHVHNADLSLPTGSARRSAILREPMRRICLWLADRIVGISNYTLDTFLSGNPRVGLRDLVLYYGIATAPFHSPRPSRRQLRESLGLPAEARVLLFVGRMVSYKNPAFLVDVLADIASDEPNAYAVFAGDGPLQQLVQERAVSLGVSDRIRVLGWRDDTRSLMQTADVLVFPRIEEISEGHGREGLGLVVVEAQAAALPSLLSRGIPEDAVVLPSLCRVLPLSAGVGAWSAAIAEILVRPRVDADAAIAAIESSRFSLEAGLRNLLALHQL